MIIWINGGFGAGKTTPAEELHLRLPDAIVYNPEEIVPMSLIRDAYRAAWTRLADDACLIRQGGFCWPASTATSSR